MKKKSQRVFAKKKKRSHEERRHTREEKRTTDIYDDFYSFQFLQIPSQQFFFSTCPFLALFCSFFGNSKKT